MRILFVVSEDWYFCSHRLPLALEAKRRGHQVFLATQVGAHRAELEAAGIELIPIPLQRGSLSLAGDFNFLLLLMRAIRRIRPDVVHSVAMKPVLYGALAARMLRVPINVGAFAGLGYLFTSQDAKVRSVLAAVKIALRLALGGASTKVVVQNPDDAAILLAAGIASKKNLTLIRGSGVDLATFSASPEPTGRPCVVLAARMLWDKGLGEFVEAARLLRQKGYGANFVLVGDTDRANPAGVSADQLRSWQSEGVIEWQGRRTDMPNVFRDANIVCLPSYREGLPKVLLEAAASGRAIVTTDAPGCREAVTHGDNGLLVPVGDSASLASAIAYLLDNPDERQRMAARGRERAVEEFSIEMVVRQTLELYAGARA